MPKRFPFYPIFIDVEDRHVLIVGGGDVCARKAETMLRYGARVTIVAPEVTAEIDRWAREGRVALRRKKYDDSDLASASIVIASTDDSSVNEHVAADCRARRIPVNVVDVTPLCEFIVPAVVEQGSIQIAISTGGKSPALARTLKEELHERVGPEYAEVNDLLGSLRDGAKATLPTDANRKRFFDAILERGVLQMLRAGKRREAYETIARACGEADVPLSDAVQRRLEEAVLSSRATVPLREKRVVAVLPAYNAEKTLEATYADIPTEWVDEVLLVDDVSRDRTVEIARQLSIRTIVHPKNRGYGGNQKTCYRTAMDEMGADIMVMVHPDHQYDPTIIPELVKPLLRGECDAVFGSRMLGGRPIEGGMPKWKYFGNLFLTMVENATFYVFLSEYHSGFRAYSRHYLESVNFEANSDDFVFDTEIIAQGVAKRMVIREVPIQTRYFDEASQIGFWRSVRYGLAILKTMVFYKLHKKSIWSHPIFREPDSAVARLRGSAVVER